MILAIDGPAGSGKSTTAKAVAKKLGFLYVDTGAMYRTVALAWSEAKRDNPNVEVEDLVDDLEIQFSSKEDPAKVILNGRDVTSLIRTPEVTELASAVAQKAPVRSAMVVLQRNLVTGIVAQGGGAIVEGRDIGTVVFPQADLKIFLDADVQERARRRQIDFATAGTELNEDEVLEQVSARDANDRGRSLAPLKAAADARVLDTTRLSFDEQVNQIVSWTESILEKPTTAG